jgi:hypothetical protein
MLADRVKASLGSFLRSGLASPKDQMIEITFPSRPRDKVKRDPEKL